MVLHIFKRRIKDYVDLVIFSHILFALNRLIDARIDYENPRTRGRHIPSKIVSKLEAFFDFDLFIY
ncbi:MAG: hypothetical protein KAX49_02210 [Halanaerobiales bacterium]|nr:hypothetical protein [Halanaerobiales bacterium]